MSALFTVTNHHAVPQPEAFDGDTSGTYFGYFVNEFEEQAIYTYDYATRKASLYLGDGDWQRYDVVEGEVLGLILSECETGWLRACWQATAVFDRRHYPRREPGVPRGERGE